MEWECPPVTTLARSTTQNQPTHWTAQTTTPKTCHPATKTQVQPQSSHLDLDLDLMEHDTNHPVRPKPQHQIQLSNSVASITPLPEAHITQKNKLRPTSEVIRRHTPRPHSNHQNETHTQAVRPNIAPDPVITKQPQHQPHTSQFEPMDHDTNYDDMGTHTQSTPGHILARREPTTQTPQNTKPTTNPEIKQTPHLTTTFQTRDAAGPRVGAEHTTRLGVRPFVKTLALSKPNNTSPPPLNTQHLRFPSWSGGSVLNTLSTLAPREPTPQTPQNTKPTNPEIEQTPNLTTTIHTWDAAGPRVGAEHTNGLGVRPL